MRMYGRVEAQLHYPWLGHWTHRVIGPTPRHLTPVPIGYVMCCAGIGVGVGLDDTEKISGPCCEVEPRMFSPSLYRLTYPYTSHSFIWKGC
jgi:hypothetical protein